MDSWTERYGLAAVVALVLHGVAAIAMASVEDDSVLLLSDVLPLTEAEVIDVEVEVDELPLPEPPPEPEQPEPEPDIPEPEPQKTEPPPEPPPSEPPPSEPPPPAAEPPPTTDEPPAPGWAEGDDAPGMAFQLGETGPAATARVAVTQGTGTKPSRVGSGSNRGGGGTRPGSGAPAPKPVSIASIKRQALPIGNTDLIQSKDYPAEAKRLGLEGTVKVKLIVDDSGKVAKRSLVKKLGHGFDRLALRYSKKLRFRPAVDTNDRPVSSVVVWTFRFVLPD